MHSPALQSYLESRLSKIIHTQFSIINFQSLSGGCINNAFRVDTSEGVFFLKYNDAAKYPGMFEAEAKGLSLLASTKTLAVPEVILADETNGISFLCLEYINPGRRKLNFWEEFGKNLARLHRFTSGSFGLDHDNYIGSLQQSNKQHHRWSDFFIGERIEPQLKLAMNSQKFSNHLISKSSNLFKRLPELIPEEKPSLLHGDLWNGNFMVDSDGSPCLIDPAVYYGHREMDLAMTHLFGGFSDSFYDAYQNEFTLEKGFEDRIDLFNLYPLLVHVNLFGGGYVQQVNNILDRF